MAPKRRGERKRMKVKALRACEGRRDAGRRRQVREGRVPERGEHNGDSGVGGMKWWGWIGVAGQ